MIDLTTDEHDAMLEVFNIAIGATADTLSQMVDDEVTLSVPSFEFVNLEQLLERQGSSADLPVCAVSQAISGLFHTEAILMFEEQKAQGVIQAMMGEELDESLPIEEFSQFQQEAMTEIGNVVLNACMGSMANLFEAEFKYSLPTYQVNSYRNILHKKTPKGDVVLLLLIEFGLQQQEIQGNLAFLMDLTAMENLKQQIQILLESYSG